MEMVALGEGARWESVWGKLASGSAAGAAVAGCVPVGGVRVRAVLCAGTVAVPEGAACTRLGARLWLGGSGCGVAWRAGGLARGWRAGTWRRGSRRSSVCAGACWIASGGLPARGTTCVDMAAADVGGACCVGTVWWWWWSRRWWWCWCGCEAAAGAAGREASVASKVACWGDCWGGGAWRGRLWGRSSCP